MRYQPRDPEELRRLIEETPVRLVPHTEQTLADQVGVSKAQIGYLKHRKRRTFAEDVAKGVAEAYHRPLLELFVPVASTSLDDAGGES